ncbi:MAG: nuclear transport factor 2 family protein [Chloroflexi bacterium]|nr:MAG: nuclear transport factor 2 family protein [Chloroflexota bacterium]
MQKMKNAFFTLLAAALFLAACGGSGGSTAAQAVEEYYQAIVAQDAAKVDALVCPDFEEPAHVELDSFQGVKANLEGFSCKPAGMEGSLTLVTCEGKIVATYGSETMDFPLADRVHQVQNVDGVWTVCGSGT